MNERVRADSTRSDAEVVEATGATRVLKHRRLEATAGWAPLNLAEFWDYRELVYFFAWRDLKVRYRQTFLGVGWAILQPLLAMAVLSVFLGRLAGVPSDGVPYALFCYAGLVPWTYFAATLTQASNSLVGNPELLKKIYFPRLTLPVATVLAGLVDLAIALAVLFVLMALHGVVPSPRLVWLPLFLGLAVATSLGASLWLSSLNVEFRDVRYVVPFITQTLMFATPVAYPSSLLHEPWRSLYALNPMAGAVEGVRWSLLGTSTNPSSMVAVSGVVAALILASGAYYFRRVERTFADLA